VRARGLEREERGEESGEGPRCNEVSSVYGDAVVLVWQGGRPSLTCGVKTQETWARRQRELVHGRELWAGFIRWWMGGLALACVDS
jgi:hypothetical protein